MLGQHYENVILVEVVIGDRSDSPGPANLATTYPAAVTVAPAIIGTIMGKKKQPREEAPEQVELSDELAWRVHETA